MKQVKDLSFSIDSILQRVQKNTQIKETVVECTEKQTKYPAMYIPYCLSSYRENWQPYLPSSSHRVHEVDKTDAYPICNCSRNSTNGGSSIEHSKEYPLIGDKRKTTLILEPGNLTTRRIGHPYKSRAPPKRKPCRKTFTQTQVLQLEKLFEQTRYLSSAERLRMAKELNMTDSQLKTWYQNRRTKLKRELSEFYEQQRLKKYFTS